MSLVLGAVLNPVPDGRRVTGVLQAVEQADGRWLAMAVMYFAASILLTLGLPALLSLFAPARRGRRLGFVATGVFAIGTVGLTGFAMLMVFIRTLVVEDLVKLGSADQMTGEIGLNVFLYGWVAAFYLGALLVAVALLVSGATGVWVPALLALFIVMVPFVQSLGMLGAAIQTLALAVALCGAAVTAASEEQLRPRRQAARSPRSS